MRRFGFLWIVLVVFAGVASVDSQQQPRSVLMPVSAASDISGYFAQSSKIEGTWQPTSADLNGLEAHLDLISKLTSEGPLPYAQIAHPEKFYRQYFAIVVKQRKLIFISAFCGVNHPNFPPPSWRTRYYEVMDGGTCVWRVVYDPATGQFEHLSTNGLA
jgi:hypothetical protein